MRIVVRQRRGRRQAGSHLSRVHTSFKQTETRRYFKCYLSNLKIKRDKKKKEFYQLRLHDVYAAHKNCGWGSAQRIKDGLDWDLGTDWRGDLVPFVVVVVVVVSVERGCRHSVERNQKKSEQRYCVQHRRCRIQGNEPHCSIDGRNELQNSFVAHHYRRRRHHHRRCSCLYY